MKGYVQIYTGDGKGKTTAALGLIVRAVGAGMRVYLGQFLKGRKCCEMRVLRERFPEVTVEQYGRACFVRGRPSAGDVRRARTGYRKLRGALRSGTYDLVIADEANCAVTAGLLKPADLVRLTKERPRHVELVFTGRQAPEGLAARADLVTEMRCVRHYFQKGVPCRRGIEH